MSGNLDLAACKFMLKKLTDLQLYEISSDTSCNTVPFSDLRDNGDFEPEELEALRKLEVDGFVYVGGGAMPLFTIKRTA